MQILLLQHRLEALTAEPVKVWHDNSGIARLAIGDSAIGVMAAHWSSNPDDSVMFARRVSDDHVRVVLFRAGDFEAQAGQLALALAAPLTDRYEVVWLGDAQERHAELVERGRAAVAMAACAAQRRWRRSRLESLSEGAVAATQGSGPTLALLEIEARPDATVRLVGKLAGCTLFSVACTLEAAPAVAVRAIAALDAGEVLREHEAVATQLVGQRAIAEAFDLCAADDGGRSCIACGVEAYERQAAEESQESCQQMN